MLARMSDGNDLQRQVSRNVKIMMAISDIGTQIALAERLGWDRTVVANRFSGKRGWKLEDLGELARVFGVEPSALLGDAAQLVGSTGQSSAADAIQRYFRREHPRETSKAQVTELYPRETGVVRMDAPAGVNLSDAA